jgi:lipoyl(octanoyl) transferase
VKDPIDCLPDPAQRSPRIEQLGLCDYTAVWQRMRAFTDQRSAATADEIWCLQHPPVFTLGQNGRPEHILDAGAIPVVQCDRGGQVTYHGPGQLVVYLLLDLRRRRLGIKDLVTRMEAAVIDTLADLGIHGERRPGAPGIYVQGEKIAALGLRVRKGCSYHGLSINLDMDRINPCGYEGLVTTDLRSLLGTNTPAMGELQERLLARLLHHLAPPHKGPAGG